MKIKVINEGRASRAKIITKEQVVIAAFSS
jgi:hypothetical protein